MTLGLRCDLAALPAAAEARIPVVMRRVPAGSFERFEEESSRATGDDRGEARRRHDMCRAGVERLYVAFSPEEAPIYAQWLLTAAELPAIERLSPGLFPPLAPDEALVEGAYTFVAFRGLGVMADGMMQLLEIARGEGLRSVVTFVAAGYAPSIRGCARVGFTLDRVRDDSRRLGRRRTGFRPLDGEAMAAWRRATDS